MSILRYLPCALLLACGCAFVVAAEDAPKPAPIDPNELKAARALADTLTPQEKALYNALRYLLRPEFEEELFKGRRYRPSSLKPFEAATTEAFSDVEALRLWLVIESGMPLTAAADNHLRRMMDTQISTTGNLLGPAAIQALICRAALLRGDARSPEALKERAEMVYKAAQETKAATATNSPFVNKDTAHANWFANHMWRAVILRCAHDSGVKVDTSLWETDLRALCKSWVRKGGWTTNPRYEQFSQTQHTNQMGMMALSLALNAPEGLLSKSIQSTLTKQLKTVTSKLEEWSEQWERLEPRGAGLLFLWGLHSEMTTARTSMDVWQRDCLTRSTAKADLRGAFVGRNNLLHDLGLGTRITKRDEIESAETALAAVALCGGLLRSGSGPMSAHTLSSIGRYLHAFALLHASQERQDGGSFNDRVGFAIEDGCAFLETRLTADGSFSGANEYQPGNTGICLLALLHGRYARDSEVITRGFDKLTTQCEAMSQRGVGTYNAGLILMAYQKLYEPEMREAGMFSANTAKEFESARAKIRKLVKRDHMAVIDAIIGQLDGSRGLQGGWGYYPSSKLTHSDNSCTQFAVLAYQAGSTLGAKVSATTFKNEAQRLIDSYAEVQGAPAVEFEYTSEGVGRTAVVHKGKIKAGGWSYSVTRSGDTMQFTAAGIGSLAICLDELKSRDALEQKFEFEIARHIHGAQLRLAATYYTPEMLTQGDGQLMKISGDGIGTYYNLYSVERGCELAGLRKLSNGLDWYMIGAEALIEAQNLDGSWTDGRGFRPGMEPTPNLINCAWAILFLKRAAPPVFTDHVRRDRNKEEDTKEPEKPSSPITPGPDEKKEAKEKEKPPERKVEGED
ncbi:MAG: hypothetical protein IT464_00855 [Planctomycetes bacterium]|nr:hypothetical protein [Planctomycetota bacterium]